VALAADTLSILVMEIVDNAVVVAVPGALNAGLDTWLFWGSLAFSLVVAFVITTPVNRALIARGRGHAVMHAYHGTAHQPGAAHDPADPEHGAHRHAGHDPAGHGAAEHGGAAEG
jgi:hypothetical protein